MVSRDEPSDHWCVAIIFGTSNGKLTGTLLQVGRQFGKFLFLPLLPTPTSNVTEIVDTLVENAKKPRARVEIIRWI